MRRRRTVLQPKRRRENGQSLLETALLLPLLLTIVFNAVNFGYFFYMMLNLSAMSRQGVEYAVQGGHSLVASSVPTADQVKNLVYENFTGALNATVANASVQVCSNTVGTVGVGAARKAACAQYGPAYAFPAPDADPEAPLFILHRVDVAYEVKPLIAGALFNIVTPNLKFHRQVSMRSLY